jgi:molybdopterin synthase catalytic subunit
MLRVSKNKIDAGAALNAFEQAAKGAGAVVSFTGLVRPTSQHGAVSTLHLQSYEPMTTSGIEEAIAKTNSRWSLHAVHVIHRIGDMRPGDTVVFVAAAAKHRRDAFEAADFLMDYLKTNAIFWKKEVTATGDIWIEPRPEDYKDNARWAKQEDA